MPKSVTIADIDSSIAAIYFLNAYDALGKEVPRMESLKNLTICVLVLSNGYTVIGQSACVDPALYDEEIGQRLAMDDAKKKIWPLLGFRLADEMSR